MVPIASGNLLVPIFRKSTTTLNSFVNFSPLFFRRTLGNLMVPKRPAVNWVQFLEGVQLTLDSGERLFAEWHGHLLQWDRPSRFRCRNPAPSRCRHFSCGPHFSLT